MLRLLNDLKIVIWHQLHILIKWTQKMAFFVFIVCWVLVSAREWVCLFSSFCCFLRCFVVNFNKRARKEFNCVSKCMKPRRIFSLSISRFEQNYSYCYFMNYEKTENETPFCLISTYTNTIKCIIIRWKYFQMKNFKFEIWTHTHYTHTGTS